jgi:hypothetical protein
MRPIPQAELQQDLQRFQGRFTARLAEALAPLDSDPDPATRRAAMDLQLRLGSAALDIAVGPDSDANLLDMVSLVELSEDVAASHPAGAALAARGVLLHDALKKANDDVWHIARKVLAGPEEQQLRRIIQRWKAENPEQVRVSSVRLSEFANPMAAGFNTVSGEAGGLLAGVRKAVQSADQARLLAERALFAAQRLPFLLRMHLRLGSQILMADVRSEVMPVLAAARQALRTGLLISGLLGLGLLVFVPMARRRWR